MSNVLIYVGKKTKYSDHGESYEDDYDDWYYDQYDDHDYGMCLFLSAL